MRSHGLRRKSDGNLKKKKQKRAKTGEIEQILAYYCSVEMEKMELETAPDGIPNGDGLQQNLHSFKTERHERESIRGRLIFVSCYFNTNFNHEF